jgi:hydrogenase-4 component B
LVDIIVVLLRKTVYKDSLAYKEMDEGNTITLALGKMLNKGEAMLNKTIWRKNTKRIDFKHLLAMKYTSFKENMGFIERSLSYGLMLFCLGLCGVLIYLLIAAFM